MGNVVYDITMSLDGFVAGPDDSAPHPLGIGGEALHDWLSTGRTPEDTAVLEELLASGAVLTGRRTYDFSEGEGGWGDGPLGTTPVVVLTHRPVDRAGAHFTFVGGVVADAVAKAKELAGDRDVYVMSADVARQVLTAGLLDRIRLHVVPILLGSGVRLFDDKALAGVRLTTERVVRTNCATHLWYRIGATG